MKCSKCGNEFNGKFCTNCGAPAPATPVCPNCGEEVKGKFCTKCGTPAPQTEAATAPLTEPEQTVTEPETEVLQPQNTEPFQYDQTQVLQDTSQPVQYDQTQILQDTPQPVQYGQTQPAYDQPYSNRPNDQFTGQQYTNQPTNNASGGKKPMSGGKVVAIVVAVIAVLVIAIGAIIGFVVFKIANAVDDEDISISVLDESSFGSSYTYGEDIYEEETTEESSDVSDIADEEQLDVESGLYYEQVDENSVEITGYEPDYDFSGSVLEVVIPSEIDGKTVVDISFLGVWDIYEQDVYIKVVIPGSIESLSSYSLSFNDEIDEVVIEDGVKTIQNNAFIGCTELLKVTVPDSVTMMDDCGLGMDVDEDDYSVDVPIDKFVMYGKKGSAAESYCKELNLKFVEK